MAPDPKNRARYIATPEEWEHLRMILMHEHGSVRMVRCFCGCGRAAESLHHLVSRGQGGDDVVANLVPLAGDGTRACHGALTTGQRTHDDHGVADPDVVAAGIGRRLRPHHRAYIRFRIGDWYTERHYPT